MHSFVEPAPAPPVVLTDADGRRLTLDQFRGRVVFLNFWATWCAPCLTEMPAMERLHRTYRDRGLAIVAVNFKESPRQVQDFMRKHDLTFAALLDADGATSVALRIIGLPVTFLLDREGRILWRAIGAREWDTPLVRAYLERLLGAP